MVERLKNEDVNKKTFTLPDQAHFVFNVPNWLQILLIKLYRSNRTDRHVLFGLVCVLPRERVRGNSETYSDNCIDLSHHPLRHGHQLRVARSTVNGHTKVLGVFPQLALEDAVETTGGLTGEGLWETFLGHEAVLGDEVDHHVPLASIIDGVIEDTSYSSTGHILASLSCED